MRLPNATGTMMTNAPITQHTLQRNVPAGSEKNETTRKASPVVPTIAKHTKHKPAHKPKAKPRKPTSVGDAADVRIEIHEWLYSLGGLGEVVSDWQRQYPAATMFDIVLVGSESGLDHHNWGDAAIAALTRISSQIRSLTVDRCNVTSVTGLLKGMRRIQELRLRSCTGLTTVEFMQQCPVLRLLDLSDCKGLERVKGLFLCPKLNTLRLRGCIALDKVDLHRCDALHTVNLSRCGLSDVYNMERVPMRTLDLRECTKLTENSRVHMLRLSKTLHTIDLSGCTGVKNVSDMAQWAWQDKLRTLKLPYEDPAASDDIQNSCVRIEIHQCDDGSLGELRKLVSELQCQRLEAKTTFDIVLVGSDGRHAAWGDAAIDTLAPVYSRIRYVTVDTCGVTTVSRMLRECLLLQELRLRSCTGLTAVEFLQTCPVLRLLDLSDCRGLERVKDLFLCPKLGTLILTGCIALDCVDLARCDELVTIDLRKCHKLETVIDVIDCKALSRVDLRECTNLTNSSRVHELAQCDNLHWIDLRGCSDALTNLADLKKWVLEGPTVHGSAVNFLMLKDSAPPYMWKR